MTLGVVVDLVRCPVCREPFALDDRVLSCRQGHAFDVARQGYVNLSDAAQPDHADSSAMVAARADLLGSGRYAALTEAVVASLPVRTDEVLDIGTGSGHYATAVLAARADARALGLDISVAACRRAARAHDRLGVVVANAWGELPVADHCVDVVLSVFSPRNAGEFARVLRPGGSVIAVTPTPDHLIELRSALQLLEVHADKERRLSDALGRHGFGLVDRHLVAGADPWTIDDGVRSIMMGPNAFHTDADQVRAAAARMDWPRPVTISCRIHRWQLSSPG